MFDDFAPVTLKQARDAAQRLSSKELPYGDNDHLPLNHPDVLAQMPGDAAKEVCEDSDLIKRYTRSPAGEPDKKAINNLRKAGFDTDLGPDQFNPDMLAGELRLTNDQKIWIGDDISSAEDE